MGTVYFTSDLHLGHRLVSETRGFSQTDEHDEVILGNLAATLKPLDQLWILGDLTLSSPTRALAQLASIPGEKHLVLGNHDGAHPMHRNAYRQQARYFGTFASVQTAARRRISGDPVLLSHFPYERDRGETRHSQWRLPDEGLALIHGHTHEAGQFNRSRYGSPEVHVGVDAWELKPVSLDVVGAMLADRGTI